MQPLTRFAFLEGETLVLVKIHGEKVLVSPGSNQKVLIQSGRLVQFACFPRELAKRYRVCQDPHARVGEQSDEFFFREAFICLYELPEGQFVEVLPLEHEVFAAVRLQPKPSFFRAAVACAA